MNFGQRDLGIIISMTMSIMIMSFIFSGLGMANEGFNTTEIPEFNISEDRFDIASEFPKFPGQPSQGELVWNTEDVIKDEYQIRLNQTNTAFTRLNVVNFGDKTNPDFRIFLRLETYNTTMNTFTTAEEDNYTFSNVGDYTQLSVAGYEVYTEWTDIQNRTNTAEKWIVDWELRQQPEENSGFLGGIVGFGEAAANVLGWIGGVIAWVSLTLFNVMYAMTLTIFDSMVFFISFFAWLISGYTGIIDSAASWGKVIVIIPGLLLTFEFVKVTWLAIKLLPTT